MGTQKDANRQNRQIFLWKYYFRYHYITDRFMKSILNQIQLFMKIYWRNVTFSSFSFPDKKQTDKPQYEVEWESID